MNVPPLETLADPHCHTVASDGMVTPSELVRCALAAGLGLVAVTDHDTMANAREARERGREAGLEVVMGIEASTRQPAQTHVIGLFLEKPVRSGMTLADTVDAIHDQGGLVIIPHPFMPTWFASCQPGQLRRLIEHRKVDGIEVWHTAPTTRRRQLELEAFYAAHEDRLGARVAGSDSHFGKHDIGCLVTVFPGSTADDFRRAIVEHRTRLVRRRSPSVPLREALRQQVRSLVELPIRRLRGQLE